MHKSISLLRDLAPSENVIDSQAQLYPLHRLRPAQTKQHLIICFLEIQILTSPPPSGRAVTDLQAAPAHHGLTSQNSPCSKQQEHLENRSWEVCPNPHENNFSFAGLTPQLLCQRAAMILRALHSVLLHQCAAERWRRQTNPERHGLCL